MVKRKGLFACFCRSLSLSTLSCCSFVLLVKRTEVETKLGTKYGLRALYMDVQATSPMVGWLIWVKDCLEEIQMYATNISKNWIKHTCCYKRLLFT